MFGNYLLCIFSLAAVASAASLSSKKPPGPTTANGVRDLNIAATIDITNTGADSITLLKHHGGPLHQHPSNRLTIKNANGRHPSFFRMEINHAHKAASSHPNDLYIAVSPEDHVKIEYELSEAHDFAMSRSGQYGVHTSNEFLNVNEDGTISTAYGIISMTGPGWKMCNEKQMEDVNNAIVQARVWIDEAWKEVRTFDPEKSTRFTRWFGTYDISRRAIVARHIKRVYDTDFNTFTFTCEPKGAPVKCNGDDYAETDPSPPGHTVLCPEFFSVSDAEEQALTIVHEASHVNGPNPVTDPGTDDYKYGLDKCEKLAEDNPNKAVENADNIAYYVQNHYGEH